MNARKPSTRRTASIAAAVLMTSIASVLVFGVGAANAFSTPTGSGTLAPNLVGVPSSLLSAAETSPAEGAASAGLAPYDFAQGEKQFAPPIAKPISPTRAGVGGGLLVAASVAWGYRADISDGVNSMYGVNANDAVCQGGDGDPSQAEGAWTPIVQGITGQDCSALTAQDETWQQNADAGGGVEGAMVCNASGSLCLRMVGVGDSGGTPVQLFAVTGTAPPHDVDVIWQANAGDPVSGATQSGLHRSDETGWCGPAGGSVSPLVECALLGQVPGEYWASSASGSAGATTHVDATDPARKIKCTVLDSTGVLRAGETGEFHESDGTWPTPVCPAVPRPATPVTTTYIEETTGAADQIIGTQNASTPFNDWAAAYPGCAAGQCALDVQSQSVPRISCDDDPAAMSGGVSCADWYSDPARATNWECTYGPAGTANVVDLSECNVVSQFYKPSSLQNGQLYADPATGDPVAGNTSSKPGTIAPGTQVQDPTQDRECFPKGWGALNPVNWVLEPVTCALQWAFVPRPAVIQTDVESMQNKYTDKAPGRLIAIVGTIDFSPPSGCDGITVPMGWLPGAPPTIQIMQACPGDVLAGMAGWSRFFGDVMFSIYGLVAISRYVARIFGFEGIGTNGDAS